jgi:DNA-damage-inducible protein J
MAKTAMIRARTEPELKSDAEVLFKELGLSVTEAINLFYRQLRLKKGLPFDVKMANNDNQRGH